MCDGGRASACTHPHSFIGRLIGSGDYVLCVYVSIKMVIVAVVVFLPVSDTVRWRATQPSRNYGVVASRGRRIRCDLPPYRTVSASLLTARNRMHAFNQSLKYDQRMHAADIRGSIAYAKALTLVGILTKEEETKITQGLTAVGKEWESGQVNFTSFSWRLFDYSPYVVSGSPGR